jgi:hypothetical protein
LNSKTERTIPASPTLRFLQAHLSIGKDWVCRKIMHSLHFGVEKPQIKDTLMLNISLALCITAAKV